MSIEVKIGDHIKCVVASCNCGINGPITSIKLDSDRVYIGENAVSMSEILHGATVEWTPGPMHDFDKTLTDILE